MSSCKLLFDPFIRTRNSISNTQNHIVTSADYSTENVIVRVEEQGQPSWSNLGTTHWLLTTAIMLSDMFGLGTLSLPADFARLGWIPALACLAWFAAADVYAGTVYQRLSIKIPSAVVFDEIGYAAMGRLGSALVYATIYFSILLQPIMLHLTCMETLRQVSVLHKLRPMQPGMTAIASPCSHVVAEP